MQLPLLYTYRRCPYAIRARMALLVAGIDFDAHEVSLRDKPAEMLTLSPKGSVPVLLLPDGTVLEQSWDIAQQQLPSLQTWLSNWLSSPLFQHCMHKLPSQSTVRFPSFGLYHVPQAENGMEDS